MEKLGNVVELGAITPVRILGLDQDSRNIGWAVGDGSVYMASGLRIFEGNRARRLADIYLWVKATLTVYRPLFFVLESPMGDHDNPDTHKLLGEVLGICKAAGWELGVDHMVITPYWIRRTGYHKEARRDAALLAGKRTVSGHEADAMGAWLAGWHQYLNLEMERRVIEHGLTDQSRNPGKKGRKSHTDP